MVGLIVLTSSKLVIFHIRDNRDIARLVSSDRLRVQLVALSVSVSAEKTRE
jgi:hypothetical protein